ncbi:MAG: YdbL family protein [Proteobacteria bacterium]|nr:YdbL family protein [Pseudomonadota bacterium]
MKHILMGFCLMLLGSNIAFALSLQEAKSSGLVGERNDGYVGYVVTPPQDEVKTVVKAVNNKRRAKFTQSAKSNNLKTEQVANRFYQRALQATEKGNFYQDASGAWVKK